LRAQKNIRILIRQNTASKILIRRKVTVEIGQEQITEQNKQVVSKRAGGNYADKQKNLGGTFFHY
jgi:hypothetical protein